MKKLIELFKAIILFSSGLIGVIAFVCFLEGLGAYNLLIALICSFVAIVYPSEARR